MAMCMMRCVRPLIFCHCALFLYQINSSVEFNVAYKLIKHDHMAFSMDIKYIAVIKM